MQRRKFVAATGTAVVATLAGCSGGGGGDDGGGDDGGSGSGPGVVVETYINALDSSDIEQIESLIHSESDLSGEYESEETAALLEEVDFSIDSIEVVEQGDEMATVEATVTTSGMGEEQTETQEMELRKEDGDWKIYTESAMGS